MRDVYYYEFMKSLSKIIKKHKIKLPALLDYRVQIPPGGNTDALVETTIVWKLNSEEFRTVGVDSDQVMAAIKATEKMLNKIYSGKARKNGV